MSTLIENVEALVDASNAIKEAIRNKGVEPEGGFSTFADAIDNIPSGIDISGDTVTAAKLVSPYTAHMADGTPITGIIPERDAGSRVIVPGQTIRIDDGYYPNSFTVSAGNPAKQSKEVNASLTDQNITPDPGYGSLSSVKINKVEADITADKIIKGETVSITSGGSVLQSITGTGETGSDLSDTTATPDTVLERKVFHTADGSVTEGTMPDNTDTSKRNLYVDKVYTNPSINGVRIPKGFHDGGGYVSVNSLSTGLTAEQIRAGLLNRTKVTLTNNYTHEIGFPSEPNLVAGNIVAGKSILGINGSAGRVKYGTATATGNNAQFSINIGFVPKQLFIWSSASGYTSAKTSNALLSTFIYDSTNSTKFAMSQVHGSSNGYSNIVELGNTADSKAYRFAVVQSAMASTLTIQTPNTSYYDSGTTNGIKWLAVG